MEGLLGTYLRNSLEEVGKADGVTHTCGDLSEVSIEVTEHVTDV